MCLGHHRRRVPARSSQSPRYCPYRIQEEPEGDRWLAQRGQKCGPGLLGARCELPEDFPVPRGAIYDGPGGKTGNIVGYGIVCVGIPIGDPAYVKKFLELKEEEIFDKIDRTVELLGPSQSFTGFQLARACLNPMMDYLGRGMDANAYTLPTFMRFDAKMLNAVAILIGQGEEWPTDGTAHLGRDAFLL